MFVHGDASYELALEGARPKYAKAWDAPSGGMSPACQGMSHALTGSWLAKLKGARSAFRGDLSLHACAKKQKAAAERACFGKRSLTAKRGPCTHQGPHVQLHSIGTIPCGYEWDSR